MIILVLADEQVDVQRHTNICQCGEDKKKSFHNLLFIPRVGRIARVEESTDVALSPVGFETGPGHILGSLTMAILAIL